MSFKWIRMCVLLALPKDAQSVCWMKFNWIEKGFYHEHVSAYWHNLLNYNLTILSSYAWKRITGAPQLKLFQQLIMHAKPAQEYSMKWGMDWMKIPSIIAIPNYQPPACFNSCITVYSRIALLFHSHAQKPFAHGVPILTLPPTTTNERRIIFYFEWLFLNNSIFPLPFPSTAKNTAMGTKKWMCCMCVRVLLSAERVYGRTYVHYYWTRLFMVSFGLSLSLSPSACLNWKWNFVNGNYT